MVRGEVAERREKNRTFQYNIPRADIAPNTGQFHFIQSEIQWLRFIKKHMKILPAAYYMSAKRTRLFIFYCSCTVSNQDEDDSQDWRNWIVRLVAKSQGYVPYHGTGVENCI